MSSIRIIFASSGSDTLSVAARLMEAVAKASVSYVTVDMQAAWMSHEKDLLETNMLVLVSAEAEGRQHLHESMRSLLFARAKDIDLDERRVACVSLGRDKETADLLIKEFRQFIDAHNGRFFIPPLILTTKELCAYDAEVREWATTLLSDASLREEPARMPGRL